MLQQVISFDEVGFTSSITRELIQRKSEIKEFIQDFFGLEELIKHSELKRFSPEKRTILNQALTNQNKEIQLSQQTIQNIDLLKEENAFTIVTGHQLNLATGPLYSIYKISEVIALTKRLNGMQSTKKFVPVFWLASEDHDFEEINHIHLFGQKIEWHHDNLKDSVVGRIETKGFNEFIEQVKAKFSNPDDQEKLEAFFKPYFSSRTLAEASRKLINELFGEYGLVIIDGDDRELKQLFQPIAQKEINELTTWKSVEKTNLKLDELGFHQQVFLRNCNLFYINENGVRDRISFENETFQIGDQPVEKSELIRMLEESPEAFSPNALMRPLYQESILPNVCYVGGGGEIAYWLQLKENFESFNITFPLLKVRSSNLMVRDKEFDVLAENEMGIFDLKQDIHALFKDKIKEEVGGCIIADEIIEALNELKAKSVKKAEEIEKGLVQTVESTFTRLEGEVHKLEDKLIKGKKKKEETNIKKLDRLKDKIFPEDGFQERYENIIPYLVNNSGFIATVMGWYEKPEETNIKVFQYP